MVASEMGTHTMANQTSLAVLMALGSEVGEELAVQVFPPLPDLHEADTQTQDRQTDRHTDR